MSIPSNAALTLRESRERVALRQAVVMWAEATADASSPRRADLLRDKQKIVTGFFSAAGKSPAEVTPLDVKPKKYQTASAKAWTNACVYGQRIVPKKDRHSRQLAARLKLHSIDCGDVKRARISSGRTALA